jgi:hypothetical protein
MKFEIHFEFRASLRKFQDLNFWDSTSAWDYFNYWKPRAPVIPAIYIYIWLYEYAQHRIKSILSTSLLNQTEKQSGLVLIAKHRMEPFHPNRL